MVKHRYALEKVCLHGTSINDKESERDCLPVIALREISYNGLSENTDFWTQRYSSFGEESANAKCKILSSWNQ